MLDDLAGKRTGERIQVLRERKGLSRPVLAGLVGMSAGWLKGIEQGRRLPPRLPVLVNDEEMIRLRAEFPGHRIGTETIMDRVRFVARSQQGGARPHTVVTHDLGELRVALEDARPGPGR
jgi:hypothetical protein